MRDIRDLATGYRPDEVVRTPRNIDRKTEQDLMVNGVRRTWRDAFITGIDPRLWDVIVTGNASATAARNSVTLASSTETTDSVTLLSKDTFTAPFRFSALLSLSQRVANQSIYVEMVSVGANGEPDEDNIIGWLFDGATATQGKYRVGNATNNVLESSASTISTTASAAHFEFELLTDEARFYTQAVDSTSGKNATYRRSQRLPNPGSRYKIRVRIVNTATVTNTNVVISHIACEMFMEVPVEITGSMMGSGNAFGFQVWNTNALSVNGSAVRNSTAPGSPLYVATGISAWPTAITTGRNIDLVTSLVGQLLTKDFAPPELDWSYAAASGGITNTTDVAVKAAAGASVRNYITAVQLCNRAATATEFVLKDGSTVIWRTHLPASMVDSMNVVFPTPLRGTANTAVNAACITTGTQTYVNVQGYTAP